MGSFMIRDISLDVQVAWHDTNLVILRLSLSDMSMTHVIVKLNDKIQNWKMSNCYFPLPVANFLTAKNKLSHTVTLYRPVAHEN